MTARAWGWCLGGCVALLLCGNATAQQYHPGDQVVVIAKAKLRAAGRGEIDEVWPGLTLKVRAVNGNWLWLSNGHPGWLETKHVIPLDRSAIDRLTSLIRANPRDAALYCGRAIVWDKLGEHDIAIADMNEAIRLDPAAAYYNNRGNAWNRKGEYDKAIADCNEALRLDPKFVHAYNSRGITWRNIGEYDKAIADYNVAIRLDPKFAFTYNNRGIAWKSKGEYDKAIADYNEALRLDPKLVLAYYNRGIAWKSKGEYDKAIAEFQKTIDLQGWSGSRATYAVILGTLAARLGNDQPRAKRFLADSAGKLKSEWPAPCVQYLRGELDEPALLKLAETNDQETEARCFLGLDHLARGQTAAARRHFTWVAAEGNRRFTEYTISVAELKKMGSAP